MSDRTSASTSTSANYWARGLGFGLYSRGFRAERKVGIWEPIGVILGLYWGCMGIMETTT